MEMKKKATIVDVAKEAGVSVATVSRVVNRNYPVKPETRERVQSAINALQYVPNVQARELNTRHSSTIGVVVPGLYNMFFAEVIDGIEKSMRRQGYSLLLNCAQNDPELEMECINALVSRSVSGIIVISPNTEGLREEFYRRIVNVSVVGFDNLTLSKLVDPQITTMDQNMFQLGSNAAAVLVEMIHGGQSKRITLENILITRESTGPCKTEA